MLIQHLQEESTDAFHMLNVSIRFLSQVQVQAQSQRKNYEGHSRSRQRHVNVTSTSPPLHSEQNLDKI